jgi:hypothetical protein
VVWRIEYYKHHSGSVPAAEFLDGCPAKIDAQFNAVLDAVAAAPPPRFSGGGKWEAMYEVAEGGLGRASSPVFAGVSSGSVRSDLLKTEP